MTKSSRLKLGCYKTTSFCMTWISLSHYTKRHRFGFPHKQGSRFEIRFGLSKAITTTNMEVGIF